jgi:Mn2+/Fe2+ NRAMP family transporter
VLVATAATLAGTTPSGSLDSVQQIAEAITPHLGETTGRLLFGLGISGAAVVATIVVTLTAARTLGEVLGIKHSLEDAPRESPWFYGIYTATLVSGALLVVSGVNLVSLSVGVQVMNALLLPIVLGFLYLLARRLPPSHRLSGAYAVIVACIISVAVTFAVYASVAGLWG